MGRILSAELLKIRGKMIWFLVVLGPLGVVGLQAANFGLRYDYLMKVYAENLWDGLIRNVAMLMIPTLFMGLAIIASMTAGIEHQTNSWKQTLALPVSRMQVFVGKFLLNALLLGCSATLLVFSTIGLGLLLGFPQAQIPYAEVLQGAYLPYLAVMPFLALQAWLSIVMHNQALPLTIGIVGMIVSMFAIRFDDWVPYKWVYLQPISGHTYYPAVAGLLVGIAVLLAGTIHFVRKDVK